MSESGATPKVDEFYWLARARAMVDNAITSREEAASKLVTGVGWFWTVYSTASIVGTAIADRAVPLGVAIVLALPAVSLVTAYLLGLRVMLPYDGSFNPLSPEEVEGAYDAALDLKQRRLNLAMTCTVIAATTVVIALMVTAIGT